MTLAVKVLIAAAAASISASTAIAQEPNDTGAILREAAKAFRKGHFPGAISIDPRVGRPGHQAKRFRAPTGAVEVQHSAQTLSALRVILEGLIVRTEDVVALCNDDSNRLCRLRTGVAVIALSEPTIRGDEATVRVFYTGETGSRRTPIVSSDHTVVLSRVDGQWTVTDVLTDRMS